MSISDDFRDMIHGQLVLAGSERAVQAKFDRDCFRLEKRRYAKRLREICAEFSEQAKGIDPERALQALIADLERE